MYLASYLYQYQIIQSVPNIVYIEYRITTFIGVACGVNRVGCTFEMWKILWYLVDFQIKINRRLLNWRFKKSISNIFIHSISRIKRTCKFGVQLFLESRIQKYNEPFTLFVSVAKPLFISKPFLTLCKLHLFVVKSFYF